LAAFDLITEALQAEYGTDVITIKRQR